MVLLPILLLVAVFRSVNSAISTAPLPLSTVALDYGTFKGQTNSSTSIISFRGIPFADPPLGALRWQPPVSPPSTHLGIVDATDFGSACIATTQHGAGETTSEDCLFGNVYIPSQTSTTSALPVLVFFHGGGFESGRTTKYPPENLMTASAEPFIFATFEYRLGQFGFLAGTAVKNNGALNVGLLDQKAALQWVQRYIGEFGGDPARVTIWGQSAGAGSVVYHLIGDGGSNHNLFQQAMADSPPLLSLLDYNDTFVEGLFSQFVSYAGCTKRKSSSSDAFTMACLRAASTDTIANAGRRSLLKMTSSLYPFGPVFDGSFIQERPVAALTNGHFVSVPVLFGSNSDEGAHWSAKLPNPSANTSSPSATQTTVYNFLAGQYTKLTLAWFNAAVNQYYPLAADYAGNFSLQGQQMYGEMRYICSALLVAGAETSTVAYGYHWDNPILGSTHSDELVAFFDTPDDLDDDNEQLVNAMRQYFTSFVTGGKPASSTSTAVWLPSTNAGSPRILFHPGSIAMEDVDAELSARCAFWHGIADELQI
ncbi:alpha/beta-hydrolase [Mycena amicta]|nr:alpha/beta-hydrolase [Mycena amicta]